MKKLELFRGILAGTVSVFLVLPLASCGNANDNLIIPGRRVGDVDMRHKNFEEVSDREGRVLKKYQQLGLSIDSDGHSQISDIEVFGENYKTKEGLGIGDTEERVKLVYGTPEVLEVPLMAGNVRKGILAKRALHYPGIMWLIDDKGKVYAVIVSKQ